MKLEARRWEAAGSKSEKVGKEKRESKWAPWNGSTQYRGAALFIFVPSFFYLFLN